jgi:hypothetical protein
MSNETRRRGALILFVVGALTLAASFPARSGVLVAVGLGLAFVGINWAVIAATLSRRR